MIGYSNILFIQRLRQSVMEPWNATAEGQAVLKISQVKNVFEKEKG